jgi:hypothetical protein
LRGDWRGDAYEVNDVTETVGQNRTTVIALVLALAALGVMTADKIMNPDIVNRETFDLLQLVFSSIALVLGIVVIVQARRTRTSSDDDDYVIDLRERLADAGVPEDVSLDVGEVPPSR